jgi:hypothetical protein
MRKPQSFGLDSVVVDTMLKKHGSATGARPN